jgi:hypothetical protein
MAQGMCSMALHVSLVRKNNQMIYGNITNEGTFRDDDAVEGYCFA